MPEITATMVKELRERTQAGMMDCKAALQETNGDFEEAIVLLRKKMGKKLSTRAGRVASEGVVAVHTDGGRGAIIELNSETDFVARSDDFKALAAEIARQAAANPGVGPEALLQLPSLENSAQTVQDRLHDVFTKLRETIVVRRVESVTGGDATSVAGYVHMPANNKIGVLVEIEAGSAEAAKSPAIAALGKELAMQIAASRPRFFTRDEVPESVVEQERDIIRSQVEAEGRTGVALEKSVEGRMRKFYEEAVLMEQAYLRDPKKSLAQLISEAGAGVSLKRFFRFEVGEKQESTEEGGEGAGN